MKKIVPKLKISKEFVEAIKEGLRVVALAIIPVLADSLGRGEVNIQLILVTGAIAFLRFIDKWLHNSGVAEKGLTRF